MGWATRALTPLRAHTVYATARAPAEAADLQKLAAQYANLTIHAYDASDDGGAAKLKHAIGDAPIDLLLANAGIIGNDSSQSFGSVDIENAVETIRVNALAPLLLAECFADNVARSERKLMAFQSSLMGSVADNGSGGYYAYRLSKSALNMVARSVAQDLGSRGVIALALHPGWVQTRMGGRSATVTIEQSVEGQQHIFAKATRKRAAASSITTAKSCLGECGLAQTKRRRQAGTSCLTAPAGLAAGWVGDARGGLFSIRNREPPNPRDAAPNEPMLRFGARNSAFDFCRTRASKHEVR